MLYTDSGFGMTFRAAHPLITLLFPEVSAEIQQSLLNTYDDSGWLPEWPSPGTPRHHDRGEFFSLLARCLGERSYHLRREQGRDRDGGMT